MSQVWSRDCAGLFRALYKKSPQNGASRDNGASVHVESTNVESADVYVSHIDGVAFSFNHVFEAESENAAEISVPVIVDVQPAAKHVDLLELEPGQCRWPYGDGPFTFCGCPTASDDGSYCRAHQAQAYETVMLCEAAI